MKLNKIDELWKLLALNSFRIYTQMRESEIWKRGSLARKLSPIDKESGKTFVSQSKIIVMHKASEIPIENHCHHVILELLSSKNTAKICQSLLLNGLMWYNKGNRKKTCL